MTGILELSDQNFNAAMIRTLKGEIGNMLDELSEQKRILLYSVFRTRIPLWLNSHLDSECTTTRSKIIMKKL